MDSTIYYAPINMGKTIRMNGLYTVYKDEDTGEYYHACIIQDATACCAQGVEFRLAGESTYPDDYPEEGDDITVTGTFGTYTEDGYEYCALLEARMDESIT
ncbi:MAG: hypothetical protein IJT96_12000 [Lachnospiraceae bacterium]|nr:hypothetical protein [Lachnospiraceae bacterium]